MLNSGAFNGLNGMSPASQMAKTQMEGSLETDPAKKFMMSQKLNDQRMNYQVSEAAKKKSLEEQYAQQYAKRYMPQGGGYGQ